MSFYEFKKQDVYDFARFSGTVTRDRGEEIQFKECPYCHSRKDQWTFSINRNTGQHKCLRASCNASGNMISLSQDHGFSLGSQVDEYYKPRKKYRTLPQPTKKIVPKSAAIEYLESRGISKETAEKYEITTQRDNDNVLCFPFRDEKGKVQFVKYRKTDFDKTKDNAKEWCEPNCKPILFGINQCNDKFDTLILTEGQCFNGDAEVMTENGWITLQNYSGQCVMQVNNDLSASFVKPKAYIVNRHIGKMVDVAIGGNYFTSTTDDHNIVLQKKNGELIKKKAIERISAAYSIPTTIMHNNVGLDWSNDLIALFLAISADGTIDKRKNTGNRTGQSDYYARFGLSKERKVTRLTGILDRIGISYSDNILQKKSGMYHSICFPLPECINTKFLPWDFATETSIEQKKFIIEEMVNWDGNHVNNRHQYEYMSIVKHNADVIQAVSSMCGYMSTIMKKSSGGNGNFRKGYAYKVSILLRKNHVTTQQFESHKVIREVDQNVYCVTVDRGMLLIRQNDCISVSGNCDSLAVAECGFENVCSVPLGKNGFTWIPYCFDWYNKFSELIIFGDCENGTITLLDDMQKRFQGRVKHIQIDDYKGCKDANELLMTYGKEAVKNAIENAQAVPVRSVIQFSDVKPRDLDKIHKIRTGFDTLDDYVFGGGIYAGQLIILTGKRGDGKSTVAGQIMAEALNQGNKVFSYSGELPNWFFKRWLNMQIAGPNNVRKTENGKNYVQTTISNQIDDWVRDRFFLYDNNCIDDDELEDLVDTVEKAVMQYGINLVVIDNLMTALDVGMDADIFRGQSKFVKKLVKLAKKLEVAIILIVHPRKNKFSTDENDEVSGSSDITNAADAVWTFKRGADDANDGTDTRWLSVSKNRWFGRFTKGQGEQMFYNERSMRLTDSKGDVNKQYGWDKSDGFVPADTTQMEIPF